MTLRGGSRFAGPPFAAKHRDHYRIVVALLKLGIDYPSIDRMSLGEAENLLETWHEIANPETGKTVKYKVKRG